LNNTPVVAELEFVVKIDQSHQLHATLTVKNGVIYSVVFRLIMGVK